MFPNNERGMLCRDASRTIANKIGQLGNPTSGGDAFWHRSGTAMSS